MYIDTHRKLEKRIRKSISLIERVGLEELRGYKILRTKSAKGFDELAAFTASLFGTQVAVISFVDHRNAWKKKGLQFSKLSGLHIETNVCSLAIANESVHAFEALCAAPTLITNALIASEMGMRFYAAAPITTDEGIRVGSVCILDRKQKEFLPKELEKLEWVAEIVKNEMTRKSAQMICA
jgi:GAF domain-containing protein